MFTSVKIPRHPRFMLQNQFVTFLTCITLSLPPDILCCVRNGCVQQSLVCTASVEGVCKEGPGFSVGKELQQLQHFSGFLIVMETPDMKWYSYSGSNPVVSTGGKVCYVCLYLDIIFQYLVS